MIPRLFFKHFELFEYIRVRWLGYQLEFFVNGYTQPFKAERRERFYAIYFWRFQAWVQRIWSAEEVAAARARELAE